MLLSKRMPVSPWGPATVPDCCPCSGHSHSAGGAAARIREQRCLCRGVGGASPRPYKVSREPLSQGPSRLGVREADVPARGWRRGSPVPAVLLATQHKVLKIASSPRVSLVRADPAPHPSKGSACAFGDRLPSPGPRPSGRISTRSVVSVGIAGAPIRAQMGRWEGCRGDLSSCKEWECSTLPKVGAAHSREGSRPPAPAASRCQARLPRATGSADLRGQLRALLGRRLLCGAPLNLAPKPPDGHFEQYGRGKEREREKEKPVCPRKLVLSKFPGFS